MSCSASVLSECVQPTYTNAHDVGQRHSVAQESEVKVTEDELDSLKNGRVVLWWRRMLARKDAETQSDQDNMSTVNEEVKLQKKKEIRNKVFTVEVLPP